MKHRPVLLLSLGVALSCLGPMGCREGQHDSHDGHSHAAGGHAHQPKYGGKLIELGDHEGNVELAFDAAAGRLSLYVLDAHAENFVRLPVSEIAVVIEGPGGPRPLTLQPVANTATGEAPGNTSQFGGSLDTLKGATTLAGRIQELPVKSKVYRDIPFQLP